MKLPAFLSRKDFLKNISTSNFSTVYKDLKMNRDDFK